MLFLLFSDTPIAPILGPMPGVINTEVPYTAWIGFGMVGGVPDSQEYGPLVDHTYRGADQKVHKIMCPRKVTVPPRWSLLEFFLPSDQIYKCSCQSC